MSRFGPNGFRLSLLAIVVAILVISVFTVNAHSASASASYTIIDLGTLGGNVSDGYALNSAGVTTGLAYLNTGTNNHHAFLNDGVTDLDLGTLGGDYSTGQGMNNKKVVVGKATDSTGFYKAFIYVTSPMSSLGTLGGSQSFANGVNKTNEVVGGATNASGQINAFYYITSMKSFVGNTSFSQADAVNNNGNVVGTYTQSPGELHAFVYSIPNHTLTDLGTLAGQSYAEALAINNSNVEVGLSGNDSSTSNGFEYIGGSMKQLPSLGGSQTSAEGINDSNVIVGYSQTASFVSHAFIYKSKTMTDLNTLIDPTSGWVLTNAAGINDDGQIVGTGTISGAVHGYLLSPILPAPVIDSFSPPSGVGGDQITISGSNFGASPTVRFNSYKASLVSTSDTQIVAVVPTKATTGPITVQTLGGTATSATNFVISPPTITALSEYSGLAGDSMTITGTNFVGVKSVLFGGKASAVFTVDSPTTISTTVPSNGITGFVKVTTYGGSALSPKEFRYK